MLCMGPWSHALGRPKTEKLGLRGDEDYSGWGLQNCPLVVGTKYHAVLLQSPRVLSQSVFFQGLGDPEVYPRPDGEGLRYGFSRSRGHCKGPPGRDGGARGRLRPARREDERFIIRIERCSHKSQAGVPPALAVRRRARRRGIARGGVCRATATGAGGFSWRRRRAARWRTRSRRVNRLALIWGASTRGGSKSPPVVGRARTPGPARRPAWNLPGRQGWIHGWAARPGRAAGLGSH